MSTLSVAVAHFLNCFLSSCPSPGTHLATLDEGSASRNRRRSKRRGGGRGAPGAESTSWAQLTPGDLWKNLAVEAQERYSFLITRYKHLSVKQLLRALHKNVKCFWDACTRLNKLSNGYTF